jgi:hypothetical protein
MERLQQAAEPAAAVRERSSAIGLTPRTIAFPRPVSQRFLLSACVRRIVSIRAGLFGLF